MLLELENWVPQNKAVFSCWCGLNLIDLLLNVQDSLSHSFPAMDMPETDSFACSPALDVDCNDDFPRDDHRNESNGISTTRKNIEIEGETEKIRDTVIEEKPMVEKPEKEQMPLVLNAKITKVEDHGKGATAAWHAISKSTTRNKTETDTRKEEVLKDNVVLDGNSLPVNAEGRLNFYLIDAHEEPYGANPGTLYLFGKVCAWTLLSSIVSCHVSVFENSD